MTNFETYSFGRHIQMSLTGFWRLSFVLSLLLVFVCSGLWAEPLALDYQLPGDGNVQPSDWRIRLEFNRPVPVLDISAKINLTMNGKKAEFKILNSIDLSGKTTPSALSPQRQVFVLGAPAEAPATASYVLTIADSIKDSKGKLAKASLIKFNTRPAISVTGTEPYYFDRESKGVIIDLSEDVKDYKLRRSLRINPAIGYFTVERMYDRKRNRYRVAGNFVTGQKYEVKVLGGQIEDEDMVLADAKIDFVARGPSPEIVFSADRSVLELKSRQLVPLKFTNVGNFKTQLVKIPRFFTPAFDSLTLFAQADERRPNDTSGMTPSSTELRQIQQGMARFDNLMLQSVNRFKNLQNISKNTDIKDLQRFLAPAFSSDFKSFLGSEDTDKDYIFSLPTDFRPEPEKGGAIIINVTESEVEGGQSAARLFQITDLSISYKFSSRELLLWLTSIETGRPVPNASIMLISSSDAQLFPGRSDKDGLIKISNGQTFPGIRFEQNEPEIISEEISINQLVGAMAASDSDAAFIKFNSNRFFPSAVTQASPDQLKSLSGRGHLFTERGVYRPGETVYFKATAREYVDHDIVSPAHKPVKITITNPRGETVYSEEHLLNEYGSAADEFALPAFSQLGQYNITVSMIASATDKAALIDPAWNFLMNRPERKGKSENQEQEPTREIEIANTGFQVQEFEPPRHFVSINMHNEERPSRKVIGRDDKQTFLVAEIEAQYYTGGPLRHAKVQWTAHLVGNNQTENTYPLFQFGNNDSLKELIESGNSILTNDGKLSLALPVSNSVLSGLNSIEISATVLDIDTRPATIVERYAHQPEFAVGISKVPESLTQGLEVPIQVMAVDAKGDRVNSGQVSLEIMRKRWFYTQKRNSDGAIFYQWSSGWARNQVARQIIKDGIAQFDLVLAEGGDYMVQATYSHKNKDYESAYSFFVEYSYSSFEDFNDNTRTRSENEIMLMPDKAVAEVNEKVKVRYSLPAVCEYALISTEADGIISARVVKLDGSQGEFYETMSDQHRPNAHIVFMAPTTRSWLPDYISQVDSDYPRTYFGYCNIKVRNDATSLKVAIAPDSKSDLEALPGDTQSLNFVITDDKGQPAQAEVAICVVDEAVLSLTGYITPVLNSLTDFVLPLSVFTGDLRVSLITQELYRLISSRALTGGGMGTGEIASDLHAREDFRPVAYWNPAALTDDKGQITVSFKLPDSMTSYRIYAVAANKKGAFTSNERQLKVSRDFYLEPGLPRFLTAGDKARFPLMLQNKSKQAGNADVQIADHSNLSSTLAETSVELTSFAQTMVNVEADNGAGDGSMTFKGNFMGMSDAVKRAIPINTASTVLNRNLAGYFRGSEHIKAEIPAYVKKLAAFERNGAISARLTVSSTPWTRVTPALTWLLRYPYGCLEQVSSGIIPLVSMRILIENGHLPAFSIETVDNFISKGIDNLLSMQLPSGGFAYWKSGRHESWWGTQYAVFALSIARKSGIEFPQMHLDKALNYIRKELFKNNNDDRFSEGIMALSAVNLAMNQKIKAADLDVIKKRFTGSGSEVEPLMLIAESIVSDKPGEELKKRLNQLKPASSSVVRGWQYSPVRQNAFSLLALVAGKGDKKLADNFAGKLIDGLGATGRWNSTADTGLALAALQSYFRDQDTKTDDKANLGFTLVTGSKSTQHNTGQHGVTIELTADQLLDDSGIKLEFAGQQMINWCLEYSYPDETGRTEPVNKGFSVDKKIENLNGKEEIKVGDLLKITLEFQDERSGYGGWSSYHYLAIEDPIPAGFNAINTALKNDSLPPSVSPDDEENFASWRNGAYLFYPDHQEIRNDRMLAFKNRFWSGRFRMVYYVRAICEGEFLMKPTVLSLMYDPEVTGMTTARRIRVLPASQ